MKLSNKVLFVGFGYVGAFVLAALVMSVYGAIFNSPNSQSSGGMAAFGDTILFLGIFGLAAVLPTMAALFFLRPYQRFWQILAVVALILTATGIATFIVFLLPQPLEAGSLLDTWAELSPLRILLAPPFALAFFLGAAFAPIRFSRIAFLCAGVIESAIFVCAVFIWFRPFG
ncbi:MAG: hypothetical protein U0694_24575 [Anaerolineae bacterium]